MISYGECARIELVFRRNAKHRFKVCCKAGTKLGRDGGVAVDNAIGVSATIKRDADSWWQPSDNDAVVAGARMHVDL